MENQKGYIYTIPKSGTYLMSEFLTQIGIKSTGWHISINDFLDTKNFDEEKNIKNPSSTERKRLYIKSIRKIPIRFHAFGHLSPLYIPPIEIINNNLKFICIKRHPREVLESEYIDFRFRRSDIDYLKKELIDNDIEAFEKYLEIHGNIVKNICLNFCLLEKVSINNIYAEILNENRFLFIDFKKFINEKEGPAIANKIINFFSLEIDEKYGNYLWQKSINADNKTKSINLKLGFDKKLLWSENSKTIYKEKGFELIENLLGY